MKNLNRQRLSSTVLRALFAAFGVVLMAGCHTDMWVQPKLRPQTESDFYRDKAASRVPPAGTVAQGFAKVDEAFNTGWKNGKLVTEIPIPVDKALLERGEERFNIFCSHCHGMVGDGNGMISQRGLSLKRKPADYHTPRLREMAVGHFFDVITRGYGVMFGQPSKIEPRDRWAIAAYIRALQLSQFSKVDDVPSDELAKLRGKQGGELN